MYTCPLCFKDTDKLVKRIFELESVLISISEGHPADCSCEVCEVIPKGCPIPLDTPRIPIGFPPLIIGLSPLLTLVT